MIKLLFNSFFAALLVVLSTSHTVHYTKFLIERPTIVKNDCVERFSEENLCQGQCQFMKKLKERQEEENTYLGSTNFEFTFVNFEAENGVHKPLPNEIILGSWFSKAPAEAHTQGLFRPPID